MTAKSRAVALGVCLVVGSGVTVHAESFTTNIFSSVSTNVGGTFYVGNTGSFNYLEINSGGMLSSGSGFVGGELSASNNTVLVTGTNSQWQMTSFFGVNSPGNQVTITNGARVSSTSLSLDNYSQDPNRGSSILITDGSTWNSKGGLIVGYYGAGNRLIVEGGSMLLSNTSVSLGCCYRFASNNVVIVKGSGSRLDNSGSLIFGYPSGSGGHQVSVSAGAVLTSAGAFVGEAGGDSNSILVTGNGSIWSNSGTFDFRSAGNQFTISNGAQVLSGGAMLGSGGFESNNVLLVAGSNSVFMMSGFFDASGPSSQVTITNGARVSSTSLTLDGYPLGSSLLISDGSTWNNKGALIVGYDGVGNRLIVEGGSMLLSNTSVSLGYDSPQKASSNTVIVRGSGSRLGDSGTLVVGQRAGGCKLLISDGARVDCAVTLLGCDSSAPSNEVVITGGGSLWNNGSYPGYLTIGYHSGGNRFVVSDGAHATNVFCSVGNNTSDNLLLVSGTGTRFDSGPIDIGYCGATNNELVVSNGAAVTAGYVVLECASRMTLTGTNTICISDSFSGNGDGNQVVIMDGAQLLGNQYVYLWEGNTVTVAGNNARWGGIGRLYVGRSAGSNQLNIASGGVVDAAQMVVGSGPSAIDNLVTVGGTLIVTNGGAGQLQLQHGRITLEQGTITMDLLTIFAGTTLSGCGTINGTVINNGTLAVNCPGGTLTISGTLTNYATIIATNGADIEFLGPMVNNGTINVISGFAHFPGGIINNGVYLDAGSVFRITDIHLDDADAFISFTTVSNRQYAIEYADDLPSGNWTELTNTITGTGGILQISDPGAAALSQRFYRVRLNVP